jgi:hypothetical protein
MATIIETGKFGRDVDCFKIIFRHFVLGENEEKSLSSQFLRAGNHVG